MFELSLAVFRPRFLGLEFGEDAPWMGSWKKSKLVADYTRGFKGNVGIYVRSAAPVSIRIGQRVCHIGRLVGFHF